MHLPTPSVILFLALAGCGDKADTGCSTSDTDGDGLDGCAEASLGTDPDLADSDGDGITDGDEASCVSDPTDASEVCYACGWHHDDPGDLVSTGTGIGSVIENISFLDACSEQVHLWDFALEYHILFITAEW